MRLSLALVCGGMAGEARHWEPALPPSPDGLGEFDTCDGGQHVHSARQWTPALGWAGVRVLPRTPQQGTGVCDHPGRYWFAASPPPSLRAMLPLCFCCIQRPDANCCLGPRCHFWSAVPDSSASPRHWCLLRAPLAARRAFSRTASSLTQHPAELIPASAARGTLTPLKGWAERPKARLQENLGESGLRCEEAG